MKYKEANFNAIACWRSSGCFALGGRGNEWGTIFFQGWAVLVFSSQSMAMTVFALWTSSSMKNDGDVSDLR